MQGSALYEYSRATVGKSQPGERAVEDLRHDNSFWCGDRRTVVGREGPVFVGLEFSGFFDVPHRVSIKKSASSGFLWNRIGSFPQSSREVSRDMAQ